MSARGLLFAGDVYMQPIVGGVLMDRVGPIEGGQFAIKPNADVIDFVSTGRNTWGQILESVGLQKPADLTVILREYSADVLLGLMGSVSALTQASGNLAAVSVTAKLDKWVTLTKAALSGSAMVKDSTDATTYVEGTDYVLHRTRGWFKALSGGTIADGVTVHLTSAYDAISGSSIAGAQAANLRVRFELDGKNMADDSDVHVTVYEAILSAADALDFLSGKFAEVKLTGRMKTPAGMTQPYTVDLAARS